MAVVLTFAFASTLPASEPPAKEQPEVIRKLSKRERKQRTEKLEARHQDFLADVEPIILPAELDLFLMLESDAQRDSFVDEFWRRRDHANKAGGQLKALYYRRLEVAKEQFKRISTDRAKMFLLHGPPTDVVRATCARLLQP
ncbi:MAG: GWxTD domain-containing protein, partial [Thermoanaerobaculia bacterium]